MQKHIIIKLFQISNKDSILKGAREAAIKKKNNYDRYLIKKKKNEDDVKATSLKN